MTAYLNHIEGVNPQVNAIVALQDRESLMALARGRDSQLARGESMGPLHGFPYAVKDLQAVKGIRTTMGSPILKDFVPSADGIMVERLRNAGAIFIGKTNTPDRAGITHLGIQDFARQLGVRYVLEGSVRKAGGRVRIVVQLADAGDGKQIWTHRFDDTLDDIFALQDRFRKRRRLCAQHGGGDQRLPGAGSRRGGESCRKSAYIGRRLRLCTDGERLDTNSNR